MSDEKDADRGARYKAARYAYAARIGRKVRLQDVAVHFQLDKGTVSRWETGETKPHDPKAVADFYGTRASFLEWGEGDLENPDPPYQAWRDFLATEHPEEWQKSSLRTVPFPKGLEPTVELYKLMLFGLKTHMKKTD